LLKARLAAGGTLPKAKGITGTAHAAPKFLLLWVRDLRSLRLPRSLCGS
jgi:hypothetical protein